MIDDGSDDAKDEPEVETTITLSEQTIKATVTGETRVITVESSGSWKATSSDKSWITIFPSSGSAGETEVEVMI